MQSPSPTIAVRYGSVASFGCTANGERGVHKSHIIQRLTCCTCCIRPRDGAVSRVRCSMQGVVQVLTFKVNLVPFKVDNSTVRVQRFRVIFPHKRYIWNVMGL